MPVYEYQCLECRKQFSVTMSMEKHGSSKVACPKCSSKKTMQKIALFGVKTSRKS